MAYPPRFGRTVPSKHNHVGEMVFTDRACWCEGCGQRWHLKVEIDHFGKTRTKWIPVSDGDGTVGA